MITVKKGDLRRVVVAIDPAATSNEDSDDTGIIVAARGPHQDGTCRLQDTTGHCPGHAYVLDDLTCHLPPHKWARRAVKAYDDWQADLVVAEVNNGGDMVGATIHAVRAGIPYRAVRATRGKLTRAEPIASLYEQGRCHHVGVFGDLETQLTTWTPDDDSPDRLDALCWAIVALDLISAQGAAFMSMWKAQTSDAREGSIRPRKPRPSGLRLVRGGKCEHRWKGARCVFCGDVRQTEAV